MTEQFERLLNQKELSEILNMSEAWLEMSRFKKSGPPYLKIGRAVRYRLSDVNKWLGLNSQLSEA